MAAMGFSFPSFPSTRRPSYLHTDHIMVFLQALPPWWWTKAKVKDTHANALVSLEWPVVTTNDEVLAGISHCLSRTRQLLDTILAIYGALWTATLKHQSDNVNFGSPSNGCFFYPERFIVWGQGKQIETYGKFWKKGRNFSANINLGNSASNSEQDTRNDYIFFNPSSTVNVYQFIDQENNNHNYGLRFTYSEPLSKTKNLDFIKHLKRLKSLNVEKNNINNLENIDYIYFRIKHDKNEKLLFSNCNNVNSERHFWSTVRWKS